MIIPNGGYLESQWVYYMTDYGHGPEITKTITYSGPEIKEGDLGSHSNPFPNYEARCDAGYYESVNFEYKGFEFGSSYLSGCFNAYLFKTNGPTKDNKEVKPSMSLWGNVI